jgi:putative phosphoesterase
MLLALLSDSHDNESTTRAALALLAPHKPDAYLHAGDLVSPHMLDLFTGLPFHFVFGNNEFDHASLRSRARALNLHCHDFFADLTLAGKRIALLHGHDGKLMHSLLRSATYDFLIHGHTHVHRHEKVQSNGRTIHIINPGALHRAKPKSVCLLNLATSTLLSLHL